MKFIKLSSFLAATLLSTSVMAIDCLKKSDNYIAQGEDYFDAEDHLTFSNKQKKELQKLLKELKGEWKGTFYEVDCRGPQSALRVHDVNSSVKAKVASGRHETIAFRLAKKNKSTTRTELVELFNKYNLFEFKKRQSEIEMVEKFYSGRAGGGSNLVERQITFTRPDKKTLKIDVTGYINGYFGYKHSIDLKKS
ncbi:hypothetical protein [Endozoicomonas arenosclerae]|uniref:hypothetical protein n=1 Tax=Endozoicomonas arenosclerae TaxID=1633495 RepID=UPI00078569F0|nr:hypothetical protein [Endozoicomonas arenosclerae]